MKRSVIIAICSILGIVIAAGLGVLIWWLVADHENVTDRFETILLNGEGLGDINYKAAFTRIPENGDMFWWFYPTVANDQTRRPIIMWLDGVVGVAPSLMANFGLFGPLDLHLNIRNDSWINDYNLLFVDAPLGTGFSKVPENLDVPNNLPNATNHLLYTLESFYSQHEEFSDTPLYIFGQGYGAQMAIHVANALKNYKYISPNLKGIVLGNPIISPALVLTKLGFYLEELGYIDFKGREAIENYVIEINDYLNKGQLQDAFDLLLKLEKFINEETGAVAVNLGHIVEKLSDENNRDYFGQLTYLQEMTNYTENLQDFMNSKLAPALGITEPAFDIRREELIEQFGKSFTTPIVDKVEEILRDTNLTVTIYNSNLDAVSNTLGQLEWINSLRWPGQQEFLNSSRQTLIINRVIEGYFRETERLTFYWINVAGLLVPLDNPVAIRRVIRRIMDE